MADMSVWNCPTEIFVSKHNLRRWYFAIFIRRYEGKFPVNPDFTETDQINLGVILLDKRVAKYEWV